MAKIEMIARISAYPVRDGLQLDLYKYDEKSDLESKDDWYGMYANLLFEIYSKFKSKHVKITVESAD